MTRAAASRAPARPVRTVFIGSGPFAVPALHALAADPAAKLVGVVTAPPRPAGRGLETVDTPVGEAAVDLGVASMVLTPSRLRDPAAIAEVLALKPGLIVLADYGQIVPAALLGVRKGALNLHPSLLPRHRGASPVPAAILAGDVETGVTLMRMDEGLDTGPIVAQVRTPLRGGRDRPGARNTSGRDGGRPPGDLAIGLAPRRDHRTAPAGYWRDPDQAAASRGRTSRSIATPRSSSSGRSAPTNPGRARSSTPPRDG